MGIKPQMSKAAQQAQAKQAAKFKAFLAAPPRSTPPTERELLMAKLALGIETKQALIVKLQIEQAARQVKANAKALDDLKFSQTIRDLVLEAKAQNDALAEHARNRGK
jgi:acyl-CoA reductase-like NAD-dependent aldehyde dehydrogenase